MDKVGACLGYNGRPVHTRGLSSAPKLVSARVVAARAAACSGDPAKERVCGEDPAAGLVRI